MRILQVTQYFRNNDAASLVVATLGRELRRRGHLISIATPDSKHSLNQPTSIIDKTPRRLFAFFAESSVGRFLSCTMMYIPLFISCMRSYKKGCLDFIIAHHHNHHMALRFSMLLSSLLKIPYVAFIHDVHTFSPTGTLAERIYDALMISVNRNPLKRARLVCVQSAEIKKDIATKLAVCADRIAVLPNPIDVRVSIGDPHRLLAQVKAIREAHGIIHDKVLLFLGTAYRERGPEIMLRALPRIMEVCHEIVLIFVGKAPIKDELENLAKTLGIKNNVLFTGEVPHELVPAYLSLADVAIGPLVPPPTRFTLPIKILEYMASAKPIVANRYSVASGLIVHGVSGWLLTTGDERELGESIIRLLRHPSQAKRFGENARKHVLKNYDIKVIVDRFEKILETSKLLGSKKTGSSSRT